MKRFYSFLLMAYLIYGGGVPVSAQGDPEGFVMEEPQTETKIKFFDNRIVIENLPKDDVLEIFNIMGVKVYSRRIHAGTNEYTLSLPKGYYIIKIGKITKKVAIK
jgi:hypothetical protein